MPQQWPYIPSMNCNWNVYYVFLGEDDIAFSNHLTKTTEDKFIYSNEIWLYTVVSFRKMCYYTSLWSTYIAILVAPFLMFVFFINTTSRIMFRSIERSRGRRSCCVNQFKSRHSTVINSTFRGKRMLLFIHWFVARYCDQ